MKQTWQIGVTVGIVLEVFLNGVIAEMHVLLASGEIEVFGTEAKVTIFEHPDGQRIPVGDEKPLTNVEFGVVNEQRSFDVLLNDEFPIADQRRRAQLENIFQSIVNHDS